MDLHKAFLGLGHELQRSDEEVLGCRGWGVDPCVRNKRNEKEGGRDRAAEAQGQV